jgi:hypothetical protein
VRAARSGVTSSGSAGRKGMGLIGGAHVSMRGERQGTKAESTNPKGKCTHQNTPMAHEPNGSAEEATACRMDGSMQGKLGRSGQILGEDSNRN